MLTSGDHNGDDGLIVSNAHFASQVRITRLFCDRIWGSQ